MKDKDKVIHAEPVPGKTAVEWLQEIGSHIAAGDTLDEALGASVSFAVALVNCDFCFIYVRGGAELVLWVWKHLDQPIAEPTKLPIGQGYTASLAQHRVPVAISTNNREQSEARIFDQWSVDPGETFVSVPLLARISRLESKNSDLVLELETRKLVERGKGILQRDLGLSEEEAYLQLQRQSRQKRKSMKEIAQAIILGDDFKRSVSNDPIKCGVAPLGLE